MTIEIMCSHAFAPEQTEASLRILAHFVGPLPMKSDGKGGLYCSCGFTLPLEGVSDA